MLNAATRDYMRDHFQDQISRLFAQMASFSSEETAAIARTLGEIRHLTLLLEDLMTHHMDAAPVVPAEEPREVRAAMHLYKNVLKSADTIREMEIKLGLSEHANTKPHNLLRDMTSFIERERQHAASEGAVEVAVKAFRNGKQRPEATQ